MSTTNTAQHYIGLGLRSLATVLGAVIHTMPVEAQDKNAMHVGLQDVHDAVDALASGAEDLPQTGLIAEDVLPALIKAFAPHVVNLVEQEVERRMALIVPPAVK